MSIRPFTIKMAGWNITADVKPPSRDSSSQEKSRGGVHGENRLMGNSLLDVCVFGRIAGVSAAHYVKEKAKDGKLNLDHVRRYHKELEEAGIITDRVAPMLLPDYSNPKVRERQLTTHYVGTIR